MSRSSIDHKPGDRTAWRWAAAFLALAGLILVSLASGDLPLTPQEVLDAFLGRADDFTTTVVLSWRLPRALTALAFGAALGTAGAIFQSLTRNPLGSPDVIGFNTGAYTGVLLMLLLLPASGFLTIAVASIVGGLTTAILVLALARHTGSGGRGLILTGIAISALLAAVNTWLLYRTDTATATTGSIWAAGTLDNIRWAQAWPALTTLAVIGIATAAVLPTLRILTLGDDLATALGLRVPRTRTTLTVSAVLLTATTTAVAGPIMFIALAAPHIANTLLPRERPILAATVSGAI
ncbi:FecCD family ABC transporter permease [Gordonia humi]|uniref:Iron complex transport system permease protein n=1 Tax=Gordonia humi TaxID=686429 RepID=A0A840F0X9_9ACTN|nr:iron chelate uptake ABC transporter family permease subunit [Gordonia humi]MBB4137522.1 iron complex transport system permease protein [Gordonia humi]